MREIRPSWYSILLLPTTLSIQVSWDLGPLSWPQGMVGSHGYPMSMELEGGPRAGPRWARGLRQRARHPGGVRAGGALRPLRAGQSRVHRGNPAHPPRARGDRLLAHLIVAPLHAGLVGRLVASDIGLLLLLRLLVGGRYLSIVLVPPYHAGGGSHRRADRAAPGRLPPERAAPR